MIAFDLVLSAVAGLGAAWLARRAAPPRVLSSSGLLDAFVSAAVVGLLAGRIAAAALDDPSALSRLGDLLIVRGGVEFWPGVAFAAALFGHMTRREPGGLVERLVDAAPAALVGYAGYEAACLVRDGCYGPASPIGLRPPGMADAMVPVGLVVAAALLGLAWTVRRLARGPHALAAAVAGLASIRAVAAFWLPHVPGSLTRAHAESLAVAAAGWAALAALWVVRRPTASSRSAPHAERTLDEAALHRNSSSSADPASIAPRTLPGAPGHR